MKFGQRNLGNIMILFLFLFVERSLLTNNEMKWFSCCHFHRMYYPSKHLPLINMRFYLHRTLLC